MGRALVLCFNLKRGPANGRTWRPWDYHLVPVCTLRVPSQTYRYELFFKTCDRSYKYPGIEGRSLAFVLTGSCTAGVFSYWELIGTGSGSLRLPVSLSEGFNLKFKLGSVMMIWSSACQ